MPNQIMVIKPYWHPDAETWVFDDPSVDLLQEPFVEGVPEMIDILVEHIENPDDGFRLLFSTGPFPGYQRKLVWLREEMDGNWYRESETGLEGWLCPALQLYCPVAPEEIYVKAEPLSGNN